MRRGLLAAGPGIASAAPNVTIAPFGTTAAGATVRVFTLANDNGLSVKLLDYGGAIVEVNAPDRAGQMANVVLSVRGMAVLEANASLNTLIGRYANRIKGASCSMAAATLRLPMRAA